MKTQSRITTILTAVLLCACGGGGSSSAPAAGTGSGNSPGTNAGAGSGATATTPVTLLTSPTTVTAPASDSDPVVDAINWTNYQRALVGLSMLTRSATLDKAAAAHGSYIQVNDSYASEGHNETIGKPGYTGATPPARATSAGYAAIGVGENLAGGNFGTYGRGYTERLIDAPYHRAIQLGGFTNIGAAIAPGGTSQGGVPNYVVDFGNRTDNYGLSRTNLLAYPRAGQSDAPVDWIAAEVPNPLPDLAGQRVGYPISIGSVDSSLVVSTFTLSDDKGVPVTTRLLTTRTDSGTPLGNYAFIVPLAPLNGATIYTAKASGTLAGQAFNASWNFTTTPVTQLKIASSAPALSAAPGSTITVSVTGGTAHYVGAAAVFSSTALAPALSSTALATVTSTTPNVLTLIRNNVPCSGSLANCSVVVFGNDSAGNPVQLRIPVL